MRVLGLDLGIASCGWAVLDIDTKSQGVTGAGARCFDAPLVDKTGEPKSAGRRAARGQRRVIRRRRQRMSAVRKLLYDAGLLPSAKSDALFEALRDCADRNGHKYADPWMLRAAAHDRLLSSAELAVILGHIARHRGFRSNSKADAAANAADETSKMKKAMEATREGLAKYNSFGAMLALDEKFTGKKRNRDGDYSHTPKRSDLEDEVRAIFRAQRRLQNPAATDELEHAIADATFYQRPLQDSEQMLGKCPFEPEQKRTSKSAPSFELFRYLQRLINLRLVTGRSERPMTADEIACASQDFGATKGISFKALRKALDLETNTRFAGLPLDKESNDVAARNGSAAAGTYLLREILGPSPWQSLMRTPGKLDRIAEVLTFREDFDSINAGLCEIGLDPSVIDVLMNAAREGRFKDFRGAAHISALAVRNIQPGLRRGLRYDEACAAAGYDHTARANVSLEQINSPVTRKAFGEAIKQVRAIIREYGPIDTVHIELARSVGKSAEERAKITKGIEDRNVVKEARRNEAAAILGRKVSDDELLRYELAKEQNFRCVYCDVEIAPPGFAANDTRYQVDHILPWSRFGDDSYLNKTLCCVACNQNKRGATPLEWFDLAKPEADWALYKARVESLKEVKGKKKRNYTLLNASEVEDKFKARNLTDTQWVTRLLADELKRMFPPRPERKNADGTDERRVFTRPGAITSKLRRAWGLEEMKKQDGVRMSDDRHHALDAIVLAATTESLLQRMTKEIQHREKEGRADDIFHVAQPWQSFREETIKAVHGENGVGGVFVSRAERRRARGKAHEATIRQIRDIDGKKVVFERKAVEKLTEKDLAKIPVPEPYGKIADPKKLRDELVETLGTWIAAGKPKGEDKLPRSPKGDIIRKVRLATTTKVAVQVNGGTVDRGEMARVDIFRKQNKKRKWEFYAVPIYPHEIATMTTPPMRAVQGGADETSWPLIDSSFEFLCSINQLALLELVKPDGEIIQAYFRSLDRNTGAFTVSNVFDSTNTRKGIGLRTLASFKKLSVDRLGRLSEVPREVRTWHGRACI